MAKGESWLERRRRMVRCKAHGLHFDPELTSGCALCRKGGLAEPPQRKGTRYVILLLSLLFIPVVIVHAHRVVQARQAESAPPDEAPVAVRRVVPKLDSEVYRPRLEPLEVLIFTAPGARFEDLATDVAAALLTLADEIREREPQSALPRAAALSELGRGIEPTGFGYHDLRDLQERWAKLRARHFERARWWRHPRSRDDPDASAVKAYQLATEQLLLLSDEGAAEIAQLGLPPNRLSFDEEEKADRLSRWQEWSEGWEQRIESLAGELPRRPAAGAPREILLPVQALESALGSLRSLARDDELPLRRDARQRFEGVADQALRAREAFLDLEVS